MKTADRIGLVAASIGGCAREHVSPLSDRAMGLKAMPRRLSGLAFASGMEAIDVIFMAST